MSGTSKPSINIIYYLKLLWVPATPAFPPSLKHAASQDLSSLEPRANAAPVWSTVLIPPSTVYLLCPLPLPSHSYVLRDGESSVFSFLPYVDVLSFQTVNCLEQSPYSALSPKPWHTPDTLQALHTDLSEFVFSWCLPQSEKALAGRPAGSSRGKVWMGATNFCLRGSLFYPGLTNPLLINMFFLCRC